MLACTLAASMPARAEDTLYAIESRPGVKELMVVTPGKATPARHVVLMFTGGGGAFALSAPNDGPLKIGAGFPHTHRAEIADTLGAMALLSPPSDMPVMDWDWRRTPEHLTDVRRAVEVLKSRFPGAKVWLLGSSNGALSASSVGDRLDVAGVILMSGAPEAYAAPGLEALKGHVLAVHHRRDGCLAYRDIHEYAKWLTLVTVEDPAQPRPSAVRKDCGLASAHQFAGRERQVLDVMVQWIETGQAPESIP